MEIIEILENVPYECEFVTGRARSGKGFDGGVYFTIRHKVHPRQMTFWLSEGELYEGIEEITLDFFKELMTQFPKGEYIWNLLISLIMYLLPMK